jgi:inhibitor of cysteine peptidase
MENREDKMARFKHLGLLLVTVALLVAVAAACATGPGGDESFIYGTAQVDSIDLLMLESFPVQISLVVRGNLPDGCTTIDQIAQQRQGDTFKVTITTRRPAGKICTEALVPFQESIALEVAGLPAGTYTVDVNGVTGSFTLDVDNALPATP